MREDELRVTAAFPSVNDEQRKFSVSWHTTRVLGRFRNVSIGN